MRAVYIYSIEERDCRWRHVSGMYGIMCLECVFDEADARGYVFGKVASKQRTIAKETFDTRSTT